jgi:hypothetical protein
LAAQLHCGRAGYRHGSHRITDSAPASHSCADESRQCSGDVTKPRLAGFHLVPKLYFGTHLSAQFHCCWRRWKRSKRRGGGGRRNREDKCVPQWSCGTRGKAEPKKKKEQPVSK